MPNTSNYQPESPSTNESYNRYTVSRVIADNQDNLLKIEAPADFSDAILDNNIEVALYSLFDNSLIFWDVIQNSGSAIYTKTLQYNDNSFRKLLFIDFSKISSDFVPTGQYSVTLNFFANELGSAAERLLKVSKISDSRTEVELLLTDTSKIEKLKQFAIPRIPVTYIEPVLKQIFNQSGSSEMDIPTSPVKIDSSSLYPNFSSGSGQLLVQYGFDENDGTKIGINTITQNVLNLAYPIARNTVHQMILKSGSTSFTEEELTTYVINALDVAYDSALEDEKNNPQNYRFDLI